MCWWFLHYSCCSWSNQTQHPERKQPLLIQAYMLQNPHLFHRDVENIVNAILDEITNALADGNRVELRGFGAFSVKNRPARVGRNPKTGETVHVEEKWVPFFKTGKELRERLNR